MLHGIRRLLGLGAREREGPAHAVVEPDRGREAAASFGQAVASYERADLEEAERLLQRVLEVRHDFAEAHLLLGRIHHRRGELEDAADAYLLAACFAPQMAEPRLQLGLACLDRGAFNEARDALREALEIDGDDARAHNALGAALLNLERLDEARAHFEKAIALRPDLAEAHSNLGYLLFRDFEEFETGERHVRRALELAPSDTSVLTNLTLVMRDRPAEVIELCNGLLEREPGLDPARLNRALALLKLGRYEQGWQDYEARKSVRCNYVPRTMPWPEWDGRDLAGQGLYVHTEQGIGDEIMFSSCLPDVEKMAGRCVVECSPKLVKIFRRSFGATILTRPPRDEDVRAAAGAGIDRYAALGSLPRHLRNRLADFPQHGGYLKADPARTAYWRGRLDALPGKLKVGVAWRGGVPSTQRSLRSIPLADWQPVLTAAGVDFVDLQHFECSDEIDAMRVQHGVWLHRWKEAHEDYDETAALVSALDLVISVQTALVHLSGALGKKTWALISAAPEWRYLAQGEVMPWYPAVRLIRQTSLGDWRAPIAEVADGLTRIVSE